MIQAILSSFALLIVIVKRILAQPWLALASILGLSVAAALTVSVPLYADATYHRLFQENVQEDESQAQSGAPAMEFLSQYPSGLAEPAEWEDFKRLDSYLTGSGLASRIGLPRTQNVRYFRTDLMRVLPAAESPFDTDQPLLSARLAYMSGFEKHITLVEGAFPVVTESADAPLEVLISEPVAQTVGFQVGETYAIYAHGPTEDQEWVGFPMRVAGVWVPADPDDPFWFTPFASMQENFFITGEDYEKRIAPAIEGEIALAFWYSTFDDSSLTYESVEPMIGRISSAERRVTQLREGAKLVHSPIESLRRYQHDARLLTLSLYVFSIPIVGLLLTFIALVGRFVIEGRRNEIAILRSRGASRRQILWLGVVEALLIGLVGLAIALPVGIGVATLIGKTESFLQLGLSQDTLHVRLTTIAIRFGLAALILAALAQFWSTMGASGQTILSYKREQARVKAPWWQRAWIDVLLLIPSAYGYYLVQKQGGVMTMPEGAAGGLSQDPLLYLIPVLWIVSLTLLFLRVMPYLLRGAAWMLSHTRSVSLLMATRHIARTPGNYSTPLMLLILTLSLSVFTASLAESLDTYLYDQTYYRYGADIVFSEQGQDLNAPPPFAPPQPDVEPEWVFLPVSDYLSQPGVEAVSRVGRYEAMASVGNKNKSSVFMGVDRLSFPQVAFWRSDFAAQDLNSLMNQLALYPDGVLVPNDFMKSNHLRIGDLVYLQVKLYGENQNMDYRVAGSFDLFPGWYPDDGPLFVGNLEYLFEAAGGQYPYRVWVKAEPNTDHVALFDQMVNLSAVSNEISMETIEKAQAKPERQGMFGVLSVGYIAAIVLTGIGFLMYALFSFRRRFVQLGILRAIGLSVRQMTVLLACELALLILMGAGIGTLLGVQISHMFVPLMQISSADTVNVPPHHVELAWSALVRVYVVFAILFSVQLIALILLLRRMKIFYAIKLGETV